MRAHLHSDIHMRGLVVALQCAMLTLHAVQCVAILKLGVHYLLQEKLC